MDENFSDELTDRFQRQRGRLRGLAYRMLGSLAESEDALQEAWLRLARADAAEIDNLDAWLTTVVARICLNMLRSRATRGEVELDLTMPDPVVSPVEPVDPETEVLLADSVGLALQVVLSTLSPAERLSFVLHDMFAVPFEQIAGMLGRTVESTRQLASRARRRVQDSPQPDADLAAQRTVVDAFFAAAHDGDFEALLRVLDPDVVVRSDFGGARGMVLVSGPQAVAAQAQRYREVGARTPVLVNGAPGVVVRRPDGQVFSVMAFTVVDGRVVAIDALADLDRLAALDLPR